MTDSTLQFYQFPYMSDNYGVLVHDAVSGETACVDAGDADAALQALQHTGWTLTQIWITHHHADHTAGLSALKQATNAAVTGPDASLNPATPIVGIDRFVNEGDSFVFGANEADTVAVLHTPGHTLDMVNYSLPAAGVYFAGDTLFTMGCGKLFEGTPEMMWTSLNKIMTLPPATVVYCSHEYTVENGEFAVQVEPDNTALQQRMEQSISRRADGLPTVPSTLAEELATNPFLRASDQHLRDTLGLASASDLEVFTEVRKRRG